jgi:uncharacterized protein YjbJ (UPF0337 family)
MDKDSNHDHWMELKSKIKAQWDKLTDDDLNGVGGKRDHLLGKIQERHGLTRTEAETQFSDWHEKNPTNFFERY